MKVFMISGLDLMMVFLLSMLLIIHTHSPKFKLLSTKSKESEGLKKHPLWLSAINPISKIVGKSEKTRSSSC